MSIRQTHTYAVLEISQSAYDEIHEKLSVAGYHHAFDNDDGAPIIDMHGIAVKAKPSVRGSGLNKEDICVCGHRRQAHSDEGRCGIIGCSCAPGCIHDGFVNAAEGKR